MTALTIMEKPFGVTIDKILCHTDWKYSFYFIDNRLISGKHVGSTNGKILSLNGILNVSFIKI